MGYEKKWNDGQDGGLEPAGCLAVLMFVLFITFAIWLLA